MTPAVQLRVCSRETLSLTILCLPRYSLVGGFALSLLGSILLVTGSLALFAVLYSIGVVLSLVGTGFLIGFGKQIKQMFKPVRIVATLILLVAFIMVWVSAFAIGSTVSSMYA